MHTSPSFRQKLKVALIVVHLNLISLFIMGGSGFESDSALNMTLRTYRNAIGLIRDYSFFAPRVAADTRGGFLLEKDGEVSQFVPMTDPAREVDRRLTCIMGATMGFKEETRAVVTRSWAAWALGHHPDATKVTVIAQTFELPTMREYALGARPSWKTIYAADFAREAEAAP